MRRSTGGKTRKSDESVIRMESEKIEITFGREFPDVHATFIFRNGNPDAPARQLVGFPDFGAAVQEAKRRNPKADAPWFPLEDSVAPLESMRTLVDGKEVKSELQYGFIARAEERRRDNLLILWADEAGPNQAMQRCSQPLAVLAAADLILVR